DVDLPGAPFAPALVDAAGGGEPLPVVPEDDFEDVALREEHYTGRAGGIIPGPLPAAPDDHGEDEAEPAREENDRHQRGPWLPGARRNDRLRRDGHPGQLHFEDRTGGRFGQRLIRARAPGAGDRLADGGGAFGLVTAEWTGNLHGWFSGWDFRPHLKCESGKPTRQTGSGAARSEGRNLVDRPGREPPSYRAESRPVQACGAGTKGGGTRVRARERALITR